jgi:hypothetical protein
VRKSAESLQRLSCSLGQNTELHFPHLLIVVNHLGPIVTLLLVNSAAEDPHNEPLCVVHSNDIFLFKSICADSFGISGLGISTDYQWNVEFAQDAARTSYQAPWEVIYGLHRRCPGRMRRTTKLKPYQQEIYAETHTRVLRCL